mmetsp:Transcript_8120/g.27258  ORF Transcript_8120/g.27258 Transcript_8120/m.27258 type:complete len:222 (-) Transcript_8120:36-701(-)
MAHTVAEKHLRKFLFVVSRRDDPAVSVLVCCSSPASNFAISSDPSESVKKSSPASKRLPSDPSSDVSSPLDSSEVLPSSNLASSTSVLGTWVKLSLSLPPAELAISESTRKLGMERIKSVVSCSIVGLSDDSDVASVASDFTSSSVKSSAISSTSTDAMDLFVAASISSLSGDFVSSASCIPSSNSWSSKNPPCSSISTISFSISPSSSPSASSSPLLFPP